MSPVACNCWSGNAKSSSSRTYLCGFDFSFILNNYNDTRQTCFFFFLALVYVNCYVTTTWC